MRWSIERTSWSRLFRQHKMLKKKGGCLNVVRGTLKTISPSKKTLRWDVAHIQASTCTLHATTPPLHIPQPTPFHRTTRGARMHLHVSLLGDMAIQRIRRISYSAVSTQPRNGFGTTSRSSTTQKTATPPVVFLRVCFSSTRPVGVQVVSWKQATLQTPELVSKNVSLHNRNNKLNAPPTEVPNQHAVD